MSRKSRKHKRRHKDRGNIKNDPAYNPFPKSGLVKQYEPYIRKVVAEFCRRYPNVRRDDFLYRAIELANAAEKTFKPGLGNDFSTYLGGFARNGRLKELHRLHDQQEREQGVEIYRTAEDLAHEKAEEDGEPTDAVKFGGGGNGVRLLFDRQWWEARISDLINYIDMSGPIFRKAATHHVDEGYSPAGDDSVPARAKEPIFQERGRHQPKWPKLVRRGVNEFKEKFHQIVPLVWPTTKLRHRLKLGLQLRKSDNAEPVQQRISEGLSQVTRQQPRSPVLMGWIRAVVDHLVRRQREADDEAEKRQRGDHSPTFLEAERNVVDIKFYKGRQPPRFSPKWQPMARLDDAYSHQSEEGDSAKSTLHDVTYSPDALREAAAAEEQRQKALAVAAAVRPTLTNKTEIDMLNGLEARLRGDAEGGLIEIAKEIGITKGAASKVVQRLKRKIGRE